MERPPLSRNAHHVTQCLLKIVLCRQFLSIPRKSMSSASAMPMEMSISFRHVAFIIIYNTQFRISTILATSCLLSLASYLQAANQTDLENWVTAIHSASASHLAKRQGKEDTLHLMKSQSRALMQKIDMDGKMKKMAELQLSVISDQKNRKAIESQVRNKTDVCVDVYAYVCGLFRKIKGQVVQMSGLLNWAIMSLMLVFEQKTHHIAFRASDYIVLRLDPPYPTDSHYLYFI